MANANIISTMTNIQISFGVATIVVILLFIFIRINNRPEKKK